MKVGLSQCQFVLSFLLLTYRLSWSLYQICHILCHSALVCPVNISQPPQMSASPVRNARSYVIPLPMNLKLLFFCRSEILCRLEQVILSDLLLSHQKSAEQMMWKSVFYHVIEVFRQELAEFDDELVRRQLLAIIDSVNIT